MTSTKAYVARLIGAPLALLAGWAATQIVSHVNVVSALGLGRSQIANAIVVTGTFLGTAAVTYLSHHKGVDHVLGKVAATTTTVASDVGLAAQYVEVDEPKPPTPPPAPTPLTPVAPVSPTPPAQ